MGFLNVIALALGLGMDAMSVCMAVGVRWHGRRQQFRLAWHMGLFQFLMPLLGWLVGSHLAGVLTSWGRYIAAALVFFIGVKMLLEAMKNRPGAVAEGMEHLAEKELHVQAKDPTRGWSLLLLSIATSLDALVAGFSLGLKSIAIWQASVVIGITAALMSLSGVLIGKKVGKSLGRPAEILGAVILMGLGVKFAIW